MSKRGKAVLELTFISVKFMNDIYFSLQMHKYHSFRYILVKSRNFDFHTTVRVEDIKMELFALKSGIKKIKFY